VAGKFNVGPNQYPAPTSWPLSERDKFRQVVDEYHGAMMGLARKVLQVLALGLGLEEGWFAVFRTTEGEARGPLDLDLVDLEVKGYFLIRKV
jgi:isopenicillin N synthase-like dioxygenase